MEQLKAVLLLEVLPEQELQRSDIRKKISRLSRKEFKLAAVPFNESFFLESDPDPFRLFLYKLFVRKNSSLASGAVELIYVCLKLMKRDSLQVSKGRLPWRTSVGIATNKHIDTYAKWYHRFASR